MHTLNHTHIHKHRHEWLQSRILLCLNRVKNLKDFLANTLFSKSEVKIKFYVFQYNVTNLKFPTTFFFYHTHIFDCLLQPQNALIIVYLAKTYLLRSIDCFYSLLHFEDFTWTNTRYMFQLFLDCKSLTSCVKNEIFIVLHNPLQITCYSYLSIFSIKILLMQLCYFLFSQ